MHFVLDCCVAISAVAFEYQKSEDDYAIQIFDLMRDVSKYNAVLPAIWTYEVMNVFSKLEKSAIIHQTDVIQLIKILKAFRITLFQEELNLFHEDLLNLARTYNISAYDAAYLDIAIKRNGPIATLDKKLRNAMKKAGVPLMSFN